MRLCYLAAAAAAAGGLLDQTATAAVQHEDDSIDVVTLGTMQHPLPGHARRPFGGGGGGLGGRPKQTSSSSSSPASSEKDESPDETIDRLLRNMFERESQHFLRREGESEDEDEDDNSLNPDVLPASAAESQRTVRLTNQRGLSPGEDEEEEGRDDVPASVDTAEVRQHQQRHDQQHVSPTAVDAGSSPQHGVVDAGSDSKDVERQVAEEGAAGLSSNGVTIDYDGTVNGAAPPVDAGLAAAIAEPELVPGVRDVREDGEEASHGAPSAAVERASASPGEDGAISITPAEPSRDSTVDTPIDSEARHVTVGAVGGGGRDTEEEAEVEKGVLRELELGLVQDRDVVSFVKDEGRQGGEVVGIDASASGDLAGEMTVGAAANTVGEIIDGADTTGEAGTPPLDEATGAVVDVVTAGERVEVEVELEDGTDGTRGSGTAASMVSDDVDEHVVEEEKEEAPLVLQHDGDITVKIAESDADTAEGVSVDSETLDDAEVARGQDGLAALEERVDVPPSDIVAERLGEEAGLAPQSEDGVTAIDTVGPGASVGAATLVDTHDDQADAGGGTETVPTVGMIPAKTSLASDGEEGQGGHAEQGAGVGVSGSPGDSESARVPPGGGAEDASTVNIGVGADAATAAVHDAHVKGEGQVELVGKVGAVDASQTEESAARERSRIDASPSKEEQPSAKQGRENTEEKAGMAAKPSATDDSRTALPNISPAVPEEDADNQAPAPEAKEENPPRKRPVFRFSEPLPSRPGDLGADVLGGKNPWNGDIGQGFALPPLPPIDIDTEPQNAWPGLGGKKKSGALVAYGSDGGAGGWWEAWGKESAAAVRDKTIRWARVATDRGGVVANKSIDICLARMVKSWHETIEPRTENVRRRLEESANFCLSKVGEHLDDPVLAEAL